MKRFVLIIIMLVLIAAASGCTSQQNTSPKTYNANGVSFNYPGNWTEQNLSDLQSQLGSAGTVLAVVGDNSAYKFSIYKLNIGANQRLTTLSEFASNNNNTIKNQGKTYVSEKQRTIDGVNAYQITFQSSGAYITNVYFVKNGTGYISTYGAPNNDQQNLDLILDSLKIT